MIVSMGRIDRILRIAGALLSLVVCAARADDFAGLQRFPVHTNGVCSAELSFLP